MNKSAVSTFTFMACALLFGTLQSQGQLTHPTSASNDQKQAVPRKIYHLGGDVKPPRVISPSSPIDVGKRQNRKTYSPGSIVLSLVVLEDGTPSNIKVIESLNRDLDAKAVDTVRQWRFEPATKKGVPVPVQLNVMVDFHLYK